MCDDPADIDSLWNPSDEIQTTWSKQAPARRKGRRTYGRRNAPLKPTAAGASIFDSIGKSREPSEIKGESDKDFRMHQSPRKPRKALRRMSSPARTSTPVEVPPRRGLRRYERAVSMSSVAKPGKLRRHQRSMSVSTSNFHFDRDSNENFNPNWDPLAALEANTSPKRLAGHHDDLRDRKKKRPSDYSSDTPSVSLSLFGKPRSLSHLSSFEDDDRAPLPGEEGYKTDASESSPTAASVSSRRKNNVCSSPFDEIDGFGDISISSPKDNSISESRKSRNRFGEHRSNELGQDDESDHESIVASDAETSIEVDRSSSRLEDVSTDPLIYLTSVNFLIKMLRKESRSVIKTGWTISPPLNWKAEQRSSVIRLAKQKLGFKIRYIGANTNPILQISKKMGQVVLKKLEDALDSGPGAKLSGGTSQLGNSLSKLLNSESINDVPKRNRAVKAPVESATTGEEEDFTTDLATAMQNLQMNDRDHSSNNDHGRISGNLDIVLDIDSSLCASDLGRPSSEYHASANDLTSHMHGFSPENNDQVRRRRLISCQLEASDSQLLGKSPYEVEPMSVVSKSSFARHNPGDQMETPMIDQSVRGWGSRLIEGSDWGSSECCSYDEIIATFEFFKSTYSLHEKCIPCFLDPLDKEDDQPTNLCSDLAAESSPQEEDDEDEEAAAIFSFNSASCSARIGSDFSPISNFVGNVTENEESRDDSQRHRRRASIAKHFRVSLAASSKNSKGPTCIARKSLFTDISSGHMGQRGLTSIRPCPDTAPESSYVLEVCGTTNIIKLVFDFLDEESLIHSALPVCDLWADIATNSQVEMVKRSLGCFENMCDDDYNEIPLAIGDQPLLPQFTWADISHKFPWACFLSGGAFKNVFKVFNVESGLEEALSVMDVTAISSNGNLNVVAAELSVSLMLSSLVRRQVCPNFIITEGLFSCQREPPPEVWGSSENKRPQGKLLDAKLRGFPDAHLESRVEAGHFQYIRMELCDRGDAEEFIKAQPDGLMALEDARQMLFQIAFALHVAADRISMKHYDVKLLNIFLKSVVHNENSDVVLRYSLGPSTFALRSNCKNAIIAKLADYGTADVEAESTGQPVTLGQFTTLENTPPEYLLLGDRALQGHGHDCFGVGLCMVHAFTGHAPYEEILDDVKCPPNMKRCLQKLWEDEGENGYQIICGLIFADVYTDEDGRIIEGERDEVLYDTLYRFIVLFGPPENSKFLRGNKVWSVVEETLLGKKVRGRKGATDRNQFVRDQKQYSLSNGSNRYIKRARENLQSMDGAWDILMRLVSFDPANRASALDVLNSSFMEPLQESAKTNYTNEKVFTFDAFAL